MDTFPSPAENYSAYSDSLHQQGTQGLDSSSPLLLVASAGGHLEELLRMSKRFVAPGQTVEWVTPTTPQSQALLRGQTVYSVPYIGPRDLKIARQQLFQAHRIISRSHYAAVISTGAAIAIPYLLAATLHRVPAHYIESAARSMEPSLTGKLAGLIPKVKLYSQYDQWSRSRWDFQGSVFDGYSAIQQPNPRLCRRVVVTLGTMQGYGFRRAVVAAQRVLAQLSEPPESVLWQTGCTDVSDLDIEGRDIVPSDELSDAMKQADLVIAHAGVGSALTALSLGKCPVLISRREKFGEHVDDHQLMIANFLERRGLAVVADPESLCLADFRQAMELRAVESVNARPFHLVR